MALGEIDCNLVRSHLLFGDTALQSVEEVLGMALDHKLNITLRPIFSGMNGIDKNVR